MFVVTGVYVRVYLENKIECFTREGRSFVLVMPTALLAEY